MFTCSFDQVGLLQSLMPEISEFFTKKQIIHLQIYNRNIIEFLN
jgi:hypothetical protein